MKLRTTIQYLALGLSALHIPIVNAEIRYMTMENFEAWVESNEEAFRTIGEDLRWLRYLVEVDRPLYYGDPEADISRSLETSFGNVRSILEKLQAEPHYGTAVANADQPELPRDNFFLDQLESLNEMVYNFKVNLPQNVWEDRRKKQPIEALTPVEATIQLVGYLIDSGLHRDLASPESVAMWALDAQYIFGPRPWDTEPLHVSYNVASLKTLRAAFKSIYDGFDSISKVIVKVYDTTVARYQNPLDRDVLFSIETPLRRLQNFMFAYESVFSPQPPIKIPVRKPTA
ncbi:hypothetical protein TWF506_010046 [Arthrobotrys conoides]|uniref:Uncharacterized protein n=1 Tax=Arthrobotrys conoides TaxID=74498 RepID=A0AAN8RLS8_9PEZI